MAAREDEQTGPEDERDEREGRGVGRDTTATGDDSARDTSGAVAERRRTPGDAGEAVATHTDPDTDPDTGLDLDTATDPDPHSFEEAAALDEDEQLGDEPRREGLTPRQARQIRALTSTVVMVAVAVALGLRLSSVPSLLTVAGYGVALILSGMAIVLSRRGRTRVATAVLGCGFVAVLLAEGLLPGL